MALPSVMTKQFSKIPPPQMQRSVFNRTHGYKTTFNSGYLVPFFVEEILPGQTIDLKASLFCRLSTFLFPIMDNLHLDTFYFFVPNRLLWDNWERFQGAQDNPDDSTDFLVPQLEAIEGGVVFATNSLEDYFGIPVGVEFSQEDTPISLWHRAYNLIWNEWFRDENLQDAVPRNTDDGPDPVADYVLLKRGKRHDYFTSCLPWPQKGDAVPIPLTGNAPVIGNGITLGLWDGAVGYGVVGSNGVADVRMASTEYGSPTGDPWGVSGAKVGATTLGVSSDPTKSGMIADLSAVVAATINDLREAFAFQQVLELDARGGTRYVESLKAMWGVTSPDFRLQRPEYLGGSTQRVDVKGVPQNSASTAESPQANLAAYAQVGSRSGFNRSFVEHGVVIGMVNLRADITYQQGLARKWSRRTRFDFYMPPLAHLGEQAVLNKEIYYENQGEMGQDNNGVFGYQERWAEYRYFPSMVTGLFRSNPTIGATLDAWHLALDFADLPVLNGAFIEDEPPIDRVLAVEAALAPQVLMDSYIEIKDAKPMPTYSVPGLQRL